MEWMLKRCLLTWNMLAVYLFISLIKHTGCDQLVGGHCYSLSQQECSPQWTQLWIAQQERRNEDICRLFGELHVCTSQFNSEYGARCPLKQHEKELYQIDIVDTYTKPPYNCPVIGGNMELPAYLGHTGGTTSSTPSSTFWTGLLLYVFISNWLH